MTFLRRHYHIIGWVVTFAALLYVGLANRANSDQIAMQARQGAATHVAVCALRSDLNRRVHEGVQFIATHPNGAFGYSAAALAQSIANEQKTIRTLSTLQC